MALEQCGEYFSCLQNISLDRCIRIYIYDALFISPALLCTNQYCVVHSSKPHLFFLRAQSLIIKSPVFFSFLISHCRKTGFPNGRSDFWAQNQWRVSRQPSNLGTVAAGCGRSRDAEFGPGFRRCQRLVRDGNVQDDRQQVSSGLDF